MPSRIGVVRLLRESGPMALVVLLWVALSWFAGTATVATGVRYAGVALGLAYAVVRGYGLATSLSTPYPGDARTVLEQALFAALPAGVWFLLARVAAVVSYRLSDTLSVFYAPAEALVFGLTATGVLTVVLAAVAAGAAALGGGRSPGRTGGATVDSTTGSSADD